MAEESPFETVKMFTTLKVINKKSLSPQQLLQHENLLKNKRIFINFCNHFKELSLEQLQNDNFLLEYFAKLSQQDIALYSRAFQLALEVSYNKRRFSHKTLQKVFEEDFKIVDTFKVNGDQCSQADLFTAISARLLMKTLGYVKGEITLEMTPLTLTKDMLQDPSIKKLAEYNKSYTDNTASDIKIYGHPYDFKNSKDISYSKNNIYMLDTADISPAIFFTLRRALQQSLSNNLTSQVYFYTQGLLSFTNNLKQPTCSSETRDNLMKINNYIKNTPPPEGFRMAKIIPKDYILQTLPPGNLNSTEFEKIPLDEGKLNAPKALKAIMGIINLQDKETQIKAANSTFDVLNIETIP